MMNIQITRDVVINIVNNEYTLNYRRALLNIHITRHIYTESMIFQVKSAHRFNNRKYFLLVADIRLTV